MMQPLNKTSISIITPVYNGGEYIEALIKSVSSEIDSVADIASVEHIVINDGSTDDGRTDEILNMYLHLRCWSRENRGQYMSMNEGFTAAVGDWICFISADDLIAPGTLKKVIGGIQAFPECDGIWGRSRFIDADGDIYEDQKVLKRFLHLYKYITHIPHSVVYLKRSFLLNNHLSFNSQLLYNGDYDWFLRVLQKRADLKFVNHDFVLIRKHANQTTNKKKKEILAEREIVHKKHKVSSIIYDIAQFLLSACSALKRIAFRTKNYGILEGYSLFVYFVRHKLGLSQKAK